MKAGGTKSYINKMAIKYKEFKKNLQTEPLTEEELTIIKETEDYIDSEILNPFPSFGFVPPDQVFT